MRGHTNNVSCVLFHPKHELIVSNSEDRTIRVWDISKRLGVQTFRRESDRFWILAAHPEQNLLAAGHDAGMTVFKLERERPAFDVLGGKCFYVKDRYLRLHEFGNSRDVALVSLRRTTSNNTPGIGGGPRTLSYNTLNKSENNVLITSDTEGGTFELITFSTDSSASGDAQDVKRGNNCLGAVFIARDRFAVLDKSRQLLIRNFQNDTIKKVNIPLAGADGLFFSGTAGRILIKSEERIMLYDQQARKVISELQVPRVKYVIWNKDYSMIALVSKHQLVLANKQLEQLCCVTETVRLKGGSWDGNKPIFVYTTLNHVKYLLPNGDRGLIRGLDAPVYITKVHGNSLYCLDREGKMRIIEIDATEALFKLALEHKDYGEVMRMVKHSRLCGQAIISHLQEKGYPEVALNFVHDNKTRFKLAVACGNIQVAMNVAYELGDDAWRQLGVEALRQGNHEVVEMSYQKTKEFERLSFLYLLTGNSEKLRKMLKIAEMRGDVMSRFHNALFLGDAEERMKVLEATGQLSLAYVTAVSHGLDTDADRLRLLLVGANVPVPDVKSQGELLQPPTAILRGENWPLLAVSKSALADVGGGATGNISSIVAGGDDDGQEKGQWGDEDNLFDDEDGGGVERKATEAALQGLGAGDKKGGWEDDLDLSDDEAAAVPQGGEKGARPSDSFVAPVGGISPTVTWCAESTHAADHMCAGSAETALQLLNRQIAAVDVKDVRANALSLFLGASCYLPGIPLAPANRSFLVREGVKSSPGKAMPALSLKVGPLLDLLKQVYRSFTGGQFGECKVALGQIMAAIPLVAAPSRSETNDLKELLDVTREYITAVRVKAAIDEASAGSEVEVSRGLELAAYFTHCNLQPSHLMLALKTAMASAFKAKVRRSRRCFRLAFKLTFLLTLSSRITSTQPPSHGGFWNCQTWAQRGMQIPGPRHKRCCKRASSKAETSLRLNTTR